MGNIILWKQGKPMAQKKTINFNNLRFEIAEDPEAVDYTVVGDIDENFRHKDVPRIAHNKIRIHLKDVGNFNSCGIREWIQLITDLSKGGALSFYECSVSSIDQINMVPNSLGGGVVESFFAPYYCQCGQEHIKLINVREHLSTLKQLIAPTFQCDCGRTLEFDALEESYFQFIVALPRAG
jgi:hypothetical protein